MLIRMLNWPWLGHKAFSTLQNKSVLLHACSYGETHQGEGQEGNSDVSQNPSLGWWGQLVTGEQRTVCESHLLRVTLGKWPLLSRVPSLRTCPVKGSQTISECHACWLLPALKWTIWHTDCQAPPQTQSVSEVGGLPPTHTFQMVEGEANPEEMPSELPFPSKSLWPSPMQWYF